MAQHSSIRSSESRREFTLDVQEIERRKKLVAFGPGESRQVAEVRDIIRKNAESLTEVFFEALKSFPEARTLFSNSIALDEARSLKREHILAMVEGDLGPHYVEQRMKLGKLYGKYGIDVPCFLGAFHRLIKAMGEKIIREFDGPGETSFSHFTALEKIAFFDLGIIVDVIVYDRERTIREQQEAIKELSTPVLQLRERLLMLPIVGMIDTFRARSLTENLLRAIRSSRAKVVVIDITGVAAVDSKVANHLVQTVAACRLMGAKVIVTGLSAEVAQTLVTLGADLMKLDTVGDLQGGIEEAERLLGLRVGRVEEPAKREVLWEGKPSQLEV